MCYLIVHFQSQRVKRFLLVSLPLRPAQPSSSASYSLEHPSPILCSPLNASDQILSPCKTGKISVPYKCLCFSVENGETKDMGRVVAGIPRIWSAPDFFMRAVLSFPTTRIWTLLCCDFCRAFSWRDLSRHLVFSPFISKTVSFLASKCSSVCFSLQYHVFAW